MRSHHHPNAHPVGWVRQIAFEIAAELEVHWGDFIGDSRNERVVLARECAVYILREFRGPNAYEAPSFPELAASLERRNHSTMVTIYHRVRRSEPKRRLAESLAARLGLVRRAPVMIAESAGKKEAAA